MKDDITPGELAIAFLAALSLAIGAGAVIGVFFAIVIAIVRLAL